MAQKLVIGAVILVAVVIGGVFFYAKVIEGDAPKKLSLGDAPTTTSKSSGAGGQPVAVDGKWNAPRTPPSGTA